MDKLFLLYTIITSVSTVLLALATLFHVNDEESHDADGPPSKFFSFLAYFLIGIVVLRLVAWIFGII